MYLWGHGLSAKEVDAHRFKANLNLIANHQDSEKSWLAGGLGRYGYGDERHDVAAAFELNADYQYRPSADLRFRVYAQAQSATSDSSASEVGLVEWSGRYRHDLDFSQQLSLHAGQFFFPTSMENIQNFWESPYTLSFSSLNSWIGEEFRPIGVELGYRYHFDNGDRMTLAAMPFWGNDSMGALLAYRGWSYGRQRTAYNDVLALPELNSLAEGQPFEGQRDDGTQPFGSDLDHRPGVALRSQYLSDRLSVNLSWIDNRGDTTLIEGEYAWRTHFFIAGFSWFVTEQFEVLAEASQGNSTMGAGPGVDIDFYSGYVMASYLFDPLRLSVRADQFGIDDLDAVDQDSHEIGRSYTLALMWDERDTPLKLGGEFLYLNSKRRRALVDGVVAHDEESVSVSLLAQYQF